MSAFSDEFDCLLLLLSVGFLVNIITGRSIYSTLAGSLTYKWRTFLTLLTHNVKVVLANKHPWSWYWLFSDLPTHTVCDSRFNVQEAKRKNANSYGHFLLPSILWSGHSMSIDSSFLRQRYFLCHLQIKSHIPEHVAKSFNNALVKV